MRYLPQIVCFMLTFALGAIFLLIVQRAAHLPPPGSDMTYADFIGIMLTALGVMLTALTIFLGVLAVLGWTTFENKLKDHSTNYIQGELSSNGKLRYDLEKLITDIAYRGVENFKAQQGLNPEVDAGSESEYND